MSRKTQLRFSIEAQDCQEKRSCMDTKRGKNIKRGGHLEKKKKTSGYMGGRTRLYLYLGTPRLGFCSFLAWSPGGSLEDGKAPFVVQARRTGHGTLPGHVILMDSSLMERGLKKGQLAATEEYGEFRIAIWSDVLIVLMFICIWRRFLT